MFRRIVVGADESPAGHDAVALGAALATATGAGLTLLEAFCPLPVSSVEELDRRGQTRASERQLSAARRRFAPLAHIASVAETDPARALLAESRTWHADLIVIGSSRDAEMGRCSIGQTGRRLLAKSPSAMAIAQRGLHEHAVAISKIVVGYDGGPESDRALQFADELAVQAGAQLLVETVAKDPMPTLLRGESPTPELLGEIRDGVERSAERMGKRAAARLAARCHASGEVGEPGAVLRDLSATVDLTVIGSRRWGLLPRVVLGGVGEALAADCGSSLVIVGSPPEHAVGLQKSPDAVAGSAPTPAPGNSARIVP